MNHESQDEEWEDRLTPFYATLGALAFIVLNFVVILFHQSFDSPFVRLIAVAVLATIAFGGGGLMRRYGSPKVKAIGLGLMIGWAVASIVSLGSCTGIRPFPEYY